MSVYKDEKRNSWYVKFRYIDYYGIKKQTTKRGFATKREASEWEAAEKLKRNFNLDMTFSKFYEIYEVDVRHRVKETTWENKETMVKTKIIPFFGERKMIEISAKDVRHWQKEMIEYRDEKGKSYSQSYLATLHAQLSAIFNHAVKFYDLKNNPAKIAGSMGSKRGGNIMFWTQEQYKAFIECVMDKPLSFYGFEMLYWCGLRIGELLALTSEDFDFEKNTVSITKNYQVVKGEKLILTPKTAKSVRTIYMPEFLSEEMEDMINSMYKPEGKERIFPLSKRYFQHEMDRGCELSGVKRIRLHDLRHSHVSLSQGYFWDSLSDCLR